MQEDIDDQLNEFKQELLDQNNMYYGKDAGVTKHITQQENDRLNAAEGKVKTLHERQKESIQ